MKPCISSTARAHDESNLVHVSYSKLYISQPRYFPCANLRTPRPLLCTSTSCVSRSTTARLNVSQSFYFQRREGRCVQVPDIETFVLRDPVTFDADAEHEPGAFAAPAQLELRRLAASARRTALPSQSGNNVTEPTPFPPQQRADSVLCARRA